MESAVLTGDLINSQDISPKVKQNLYNKFSKYLHDLSENRANHFRGEVNRGDWFQCIVYDPKFALRYSLRIKFFLRSFALFEKPDLVDEIIGKKPKVIPKAIIDARIAIGVGEIDFLNNRLGNSDGQAFQLSGRLLDNMKTQRNGLNIDISDEEELKGELQTIFILLDTLIQKTTPAQCQVMYHKLNGKTESEIALKLKIYQSAVNQRSTSGGWRAIEAAINHYEKLFE